ncbi:hypothetical protein WICMUC_005179 [Wickerhamomyces mucosus]|uniref:AP complex subunit beta n=1 Tax=Wickerhamomyces mucosus TaxID=1378264 RepID=A0A9P8PA10_9ASCO|nr:hypothetical protein WICMUC_005179 [Wickerhamomyces mucosus]
MEGHDMINVYPQVIEMFNTDDLEAKRMCYYFIGTYALSKPDLTLSTLPIIINDLNTGSPQVVALALKNITSIPIREFFKESIRPIRKSLKSENISVRKAAIFTIARLWERDPKMVNDEGLMATLYDLIEDKSTNIVAAALTVLLDIQDKSSDLKLSFNKGQAVYLADLLGNADDWDQLTILNSLMNFTPQTHDESYTLIDKVISLLHHENSSVVLNTFKLMLYLLNYASEIEEYIIRKMTSSLTSLLSKPDEIRFLVLRNVILLILSKPKVFHFDVSLFFCAFDDPIFVKDTKLEIIYLLANESNLSIVLQELAEYSIDVDVQMSKKAVRAIGNLAVKLEAASKTCVDTLLDLASNDIYYVNQEIVIVFKNIFRRYNQFDYALSKIISHADKIEEPDSRSALIWIIGHFARKIPKAESLLADLVSGFGEDPLDVQLCSLTSVVKLFIQKPEEGQDVVLEILKKATEEVDNPDVRERGFFYWRLLSAQAKFPGTAKDIVDGEVPLISNENEQLDPIILEELELNIGSLASVYLKPVGQVFRLSKRKLLPQSPAKSNGFSNIVGSLHSTSSSFAEARPRADTINSNNTSTSESGISDQRRVDEFDVPAIQVNPIKKQSNLSRRVTTSKSSLSRKLSIRNVFH